MANIIRSPRPFSARRRTRALVAVSAALGLPAALAPAVRAATPAASGPAYSSQMLHFAVHVGPNGSQACDVVGEMFRPLGATSSHRVPAILTTNGFGGSYTDQVGLAQAFASDGYAALAYSGLGFGGSGCKITLDDPLYDGMAAKQLVSYLGGEPGIAFTDAAHTSAAPVVDFVTHDRVDHAGHADTYDPRVGMIGGSYGGEIQFAAAYVDPRVDTIVPFITWSDLAYSLTPNNADLPPGHGVTNPVPGASKTTWAALFSGEGIADGVQGAQADPTRDVGCPNFANWVCAGLAFAASAGYADPTTTAYLRHASVTSYADAVRIPTLIIQGENDTLFNLNEAVANYRALQSHQVPVSMIWQSWGHSGSTPAPGELDLSNPDPKTQYESARVYAWFDHYLRSEAVSTGPGFAYFRDWVNYTGIATPAYATAASYPVGHTSPLYLSAAQSLVTSRPEIGVSVQRFVTPPAGAPTSSVAPDAIGGTAPLTSTPDDDAPGTFASWSTAPLAAPLDVAGIPVLHVQLSAPTATAASRAGAAGDLVLFAKLYDVAPDGTKSLIHGLVAPARIADPTRPVEITLPGIAHRFAAGHRLELVLAGGDVNYRGNITPTPVSITTGTMSQVLDLPVVP